MARAVLGVRTSAHSLIREKIMKNAVLKSIIPGALALLLALPTAQAQEAAGKPNVIILATGGTIAGAGASALRSGRP